MKLTKTTFLFGCAVGGMSAALAPLLLTSTQAETKLLPFQGRLTDADGKPIAPDQVKVVEFKMYDAPTGGAVKWAGEVHKLSVNGGLVNTMLGSKATLGGVDFSLPTYLQITIDANNDGQINAADPPLLPRQSVIPAVYAAVTGQMQYAVPASGGKPAGVASKGWEAVFDNGNPDSGRIPAAKLVDNSITAGQLASGAVETAKIKDGAVTGGKILPGTITDREIAPDSAAMGPHYFESSRIIGLWEDQRGGPYESDLADKVPPQARGALIKVLVLSNNSDLGGSLLFSDQNGNFADRIEHFFGIGFSNYSEHWIGGVMFVPFYGGKKFRHTHRSNSPTENNHVRSYAALVGWY